jgi:cytochrome c5
MTRASSTASTLPRVVRIVSALLLSLLGVTPMAHCADISERQAALFTNNCAQCHVRQGIGVPQAGDAAAWKDRAAQGEDAMLRNVVQGLRGMPPLGYCSACSEQDFRALIRLMAGLPDATQGKAK